MRALVVGGADCVWRDVAAAQALCQFDFVVCVKMAGIYWPTAFEYWAGLHPEYMPQYEAERKKLGLPGGYVTVAPLLTELGTVPQQYPAMERVAYQWKPSGITGASGLYGAKVAIDKGASLVVLAGIPMDGTDHFVRKKPWPEGKSGSYKQGWIDAMPHIKDKVRSMGGWTMELLGAPTEEWLRAQRDSV